MTSHVELGAKPEADITNTSDNNSEHNHNDGDTNDNNTSHTDHNGHVSISDHVDATYVNNTANGKGNNHKTN